MKLVIDIPEETYKSITKQVADGITNPLKTCIVNGKPLPEGHGDLIDRTALMNRPYETGGFVEWYDEIKWAPAIIEADKEAENVSSV